MQHVNRAFLELADLPERDTLVGRPVESIFRVASFVDPAASSTTKGPKDHPNGDSRPITNDRHLTGTVQVGRSRNHSQLYRLRVLPVVDRSRRRRLGNETASSSSASASFQCMSHVLIQVEPSLSAQAATTTTSDTTPDRPMSSMATSYGDRPSVPLRPPPTANTTNGCVSGRAGMIG